LENSKKIYFFGIDGVTKDYRIILSWTMAGLWLDFRIEKEWGTTGLEDHSGLMSVE